MLCFKCGQVLSGEERLCPNCGTLVADIQPTLSETDLTAIIAGAFQGEDEFIASGDARSVWAPTAAELARETDSNKVFSIAALFEEDSALFELPSIPPETVFPVETPDPKPVEPVEPAGIPTAMRSRHTHLRCYIWLGAAAVVLLATGLFFWLDKPLDDKPVFWLRGETLMYAPQVGAAAIELLEDVNYAAVTVTENRRYAYLIVKEKVMDLGTLYRIEMDKLNKDGLNPVPMNVIDTDVFYYYGPNNNQTVNELFSYNVYSGQNLFDFYISKDGKQVYYFKGTDGQNLYCSDGETTEHLESAVSYFWFSEDEQTLMLGKENGAYKQLLRQDMTSKGPSEVVLEQYSHILRYELDLSEILYITYTLPDIYDQCSLYVTDLKESRLLVKDAASIIDVRDSSHYSYTYSEPFVSTLCDYVEDDMALADAALEAPTPEAYTVGGVLVNAAYEQARKRYAEKEKRDQLRLALKQSITQETVALYQRDGEQEYRIAGGIQKYPIPLGDGLFLCERTNGVPVKPKLSELYGTAQVESELRRGTNTIQILADKTSELAQISIIPFTYDMDRERNLYGIEPDTNMMVRYQAENGYQNREVLAHDVRDLLYLKEYDALYYITYGTNNSDDLFQVKDGKTEKLAESIKLRALEAYQDGGLALVYREYPENLGEVNTMILQYWDSQRKMQQYKQEIKKFKRIEDGSFFVLETSGSDDGILCLYRDGERVQIDTDVDDFCLLNSSKDRFGWYWSWER